MVRSDTCHFSLPRGSLFLANAQLDQAFHLLYMMPIALLKNRQKIRLRLEHEIKPKNN